MNEELNNKRLLGGIVLAAVTASLYCAIPLLSANAGVGIVGILHWYGAIVPAMEQTAQAPSGQQAAPVTLHAGGQVQVVTGTGRNSVQILSSRFL